MCIKRMVMVLNQWPLGLFETGFMGHGIRVKIDRLISDRLSEP